MPNWVHQTMTVTKGDPHEIWAAIRDEAGGRPFDFNRLVPQPAEVRESKESVTQGGFEVPAWYAWSLNNWGTKWNACDAAFPVENGIPVEGNELYFDTAWSCPVPILQLLAKKFPEHAITVRAYECEGGWHATFTLKDGQLIGVREACQCLYEALKADADAAAQDELDAMEKSENG